ncbi:MAG: glycoside hydrolase family 15 protein, partial [Patescibacteria group bacterium]
MSNALTLGNGSLLVNIGSFGEVRDLYFPYAGFENHVGGRLCHQVGVFADGRLSWLADPEWHLTVESEDDTLAGKILAVNQSLGVSLLLTDLVYNEKNIFLRRVVVKNLRDDSSRSLKIFFHHQFEPYESHVAHTAYFDPTQRAVIHYRNRRVFLINGTFEGKPFDDYSTGVFGAEGKEGTHKDAEDGRLAKNNIEHGRVDSVIGLEAELAPLEEKILYYWLTVGESISEVAELNNYVLKLGPGHLIETTKNFWRAWINRRQFSFHGLTPSVVKLFNKSLLIIRSHVSNNGAIVASSDSNSRQSDKDTYAYVWLRDAAMAALALSGAGDVNVARLFFNFCNQTISPDGYFMHKYSPDGALGSSWHPWLGPSGELQLPIQEDGTALVLVTLWRHYEISKDLEFVETVYNSLIRRAADFMVLYRDERTGLPKPSYDLWEEKWGVSTFTAASVYGALRAAANFAHLLGKVKSENLYLETAEMMKAGILKYLFDQSRGYFCKMIKFSEREIVADLTIDCSSIYGIFTFGVLPPDDERVKQA